MTMVESKTNHEEEVKQKLTERMGRLPTTSIEGRVSISPSGGSKEYPIKTKILAWAALCTVQIFASVVLKVAQHDGVYNFSPQSSLVMSESIKFGLSWMYLYYDSKDINTMRRTFRQETNVKLIFHMLCVAAIYCFNNGLMFWLFARADPGSITLIKSGATIVSAILMYFWRGFRLSLSRWMIIIIQMLGLIVAQYDSCSGKSHLSPIVYGILFLSLFNSSVANVWNEHVIKNFESASIATKNIHLYFFGGLLNLLIFWWIKMTSDNTPAFFQGYNMIAMCVVISNAFMGIAMNIVYKYADALVKNIATTTTTVVLLILSAMFFQGRSNLMVFIGGSIVVIGTFLYFYTGITESKMKDVQLENGR